MAAVILSTEKEWGAVFVRVSSIIAPQSTTTTAAAAITAAVATPTTIKLYGRNGDEDAGVVAFHRHEKLSFFVSLSLFVSLSPFLSLSLSLSLSFSPSYFCLLRFSHYLCLPLLSPQGGKWERVLTCQGSFLLLWLHEDWKFFSFCHLEGHLRPRESKEGIDSRKKRAFFSSKKQLSCLSSPFSFIVVILNLQGGK